MRPYSKGQKNDFRDAEAIAEAVQRPTMKFVATKTADQLDLQALHRVRERLVSQRTGIINQIRAFLLERGVAVRQAAFSKGRDFGAWLGLVPKQISTGDHVGEELRFMLARFRELAALLLDFVEQPHILCGAVDQ